MSFIIHNDFELASDPCADKLSFETKAQAEGAKAIAKLDHGNTDLEVYLCDKCDLWHLTTVQPNDSV